MTATMTGEYRQLGYDTSNDMIRHDARRGDRKYEEAALHIRNAGLGRVRMGEMMDAAGQFVYAAEDWLSAAACFYLVPDLDRMRDALDRVRKLDRQGKIPPDRRDLHEALKEREEEIKGLEQKIARFRQDYGQRVGSQHTVSQEALDWLLGQIRELPGDVYLHTAIASQAGRLRQFPLALKHQEWAEKFDPENLQLASFGVALLLTSDQSGQVIQKGREWLKAHPELSGPRFLLAQAVAFPAKGVKGDWEEAMQILQPLVEDDSGDTRTRLQAFALATILQHALEHEVEYRRSLNSFDQLAEAIRPDEWDFVTKLRQDLPEVFPQPGSNGATPLATERRRPSTQPVHERAAPVFRQHNPLVGVP